MNMETFIYENVEVRKTGRQAAKQLRSGKIDVLWEVTPIDENLGTWKKWTREQELYPVVKD